MPVSGIGEYDDGNVFARILRDELPSRRIYEDAYAVAFQDIAPLAPVHVLVIPRGRYVSLADFAAKGTETELAGFFRAVGTVARQLGLDEAGWRILANVGQSAGQEVPHFHVHLFAGRPLGPMLVPGSP